MVPTDFEAVAGGRPLEVHAALEPAREVGGDLYDFFWIGRERLCMLVADVSDKGAGAALFMARTKSVVRLLAPQLAAEGAALVSRLVERANEELCRDNPHGLFVTLLVAVLNAETGEVDYCNAGHNPPCRVGPARGVTPFTGARGKPLGIRDNFRYQTVTERLQPGESLFLFTDGVTEAMNPAGDLFGYERLVTSLRSSAHQPARALIASVLNEVRAFAGMAAPSDDIAALACRWLG
jgi:sigma-B regulation protein RsbU (phosphoserine phosphatase)